MTLFKQSGYLVAALLAKDSQLSQWIEQWQSSAWVFAAITTFDESSEESWVASSAATALS